MNKNMKQNSKRTLKLIAYLCIVVVCVGLFALVPRLFSVNDMLFQTIAVVLSVVFSAVVTSTLLTGQTSNEEAREKNIKVYENKITVYSNFVSEMWKLLENPSEESVKELRKLLFAKPVFMIEPDSLSIITMKIASCDINDENAWKTLCSVITSTLRKELEGVGYDYFSDLWNAFDRDIDIDATTSGEMPIPSKDATHANTDAADVTSHHVSTPCIHFNILDQNWQNEIFANGAYALALCEYNEVWRTNLIKRCKENDIVFLYQTGGPGYVGAFLAKGWVVFESEGDGKITREVKWVFAESEKPIVIEDEDHQAKDVDLYCAAGCLTDGYTRISYLLVEPLIYTEGGVSNISVYRRTISTYDSNYAWRTLGRFKSMLEDWNDGNLNTFSYDGEKKLMAVNEVALKQIFSDNNILTSTWNEGIGWIDK